MSGRKNTIKSRTVVVQKLAAEYTKSLLLITKEKKKNLKHFFIHDTTIYSSM